MTGGDQELGSVHSERNAKKVNAKPEAGQVTIGSALPPLSVRKESPLGPVGALHHALLKDLCTTTRGLAPRVTREFHPISSGTSLFDLLACAVM